MMFQELLKKERTGHLPTLEIIRYVWDNYQKIKAFDDFHPVFLNKLINITGTPEHKQIHGAIPMLSGVENHTFIFQEDQKIYGAFDIDFYGGSLANFRLQVFSDGFLAKRRVDKKREFFLSVIKQKLPEVRFEYVTMADALVWRDTQTTLVITLRKVIQMAAGQPRSASIAIMKEKYSGLNDSV